jgi:ribosomal protein L24E
MNRGCIALTELNCDSCGQTVEPGQKYLLLEDEGKITRFCVDCSIKKHLASYKVEKGEKVLTFLQ